MAKKQQTEQQPERQERDETTVEKLDRTAAANAVLAAMDDDETTLAELAKKADALFVERGDGKSNIDRAEWEVWRSIRALEAMGLLETEDSEIVVRKVRKRPDEVARAASFSAPGPGRTCKGGPTCRLYPGAPSAPSRSSAWTANSCARTAPPTK